jgi:AcrR family transcriptional regulator
MPQVLKDEVRDALCKAALEAFASDGYLGATMAGIATRAGTGAATIYRYYAKKEDLFAAVVTPAIATRFAQLLEARVERLADAALRAKGAGDLGPEMLSFWIEHRLEVVILLDRAAGTSYARYGEEFVDMMVDATLKGIRAERPGLRISAPSRFVLRRIFENTRRMLASILAAHDDAPSLKDAIEAFWSYQIPGIHGFARRLLG